MNRHVVVGRLGLDDAVSVPVGRDEIATDLQLVAGQARLDHGIGEALTDLARLGLVPSERGVDMLILAAHVQAADTRVSRAFDSQDSWTRELRLVIPVSEPNVWNEAAPALGRLLNFLTGDRWTLQFRSRPEPFATITSPLDLEIACVPYDHLALFSGGLDSLIGAIDAIEADKTPLLISHAGDGATSDAQSTLLDALHQEYPNRDLSRLRVWMAFPEGLVEDSASESSTRGRSFLFFAIGVLAGTAMSGETVVLSVPENGLIAINVPLDTLRLGSLSTRTTHPFYISVWNEVLETLDIPVRIENPYWKLTKGEMVSGCNNRPLLRGLASLSISCSSPTKGRWQGLGIQHCGYCLPCLIRRAALTAGLGADADPTTYTIQDLRGRPLSTREAEGLQVRSFQFAIDRLRARPELAKLLIHKPGPLGGRSAAELEALAAMYRRGLEEVGALIAGVRTVSR